MAMTDYLRLAVTFFAAINPAAVALGFALRADAPPRGQRPRPAVLACAVAAGLFAIAAVAARPALDFLDVEAETFRVAAGAVMAVVGGLWLWPWRPGPAATPGGWRAGVYPLGLPLIAGPAGLMGAVSFSAGEGAALAFAATLPAVALAAILTLFAHPRLRPAMLVLAPLTGALLVAVAAGLIVSGVRDI